jgi:hypothetical protein
MATATGTSRTVPARRTEPLRLPRTTGALSGLLIIVLGVWGGLIPFIGPYFHYSFGGDHTWHFTMQRLWLDILPGAVAVLGGFMLMTASSRIGGLIAGWIALIAGAWFVVGPAVALLWDQNIYAIGAPHGGSVRRMLEWVGYFGGVGAVIVGLAAFAMGRYFSRPRVGEEVGVVAADAAAMEAHRRHEPVTRTAVADAPVEERTAVRDAPVEERTAVRDAPAEERTAVADAPVAERRDEPVTDTRAADEPVAGTRDTDISAADARAADARAADTRAADSPTTAVPTATATTGPATTASTRRRSGGLLGRFRR